MTVPYRHPTWQETLQNSTVTAPTEQQVPYPSGVVGKQFPQYAEGLPAPQAPMDWKDHLRTNVYGVPTPTQILPVNTPTPEAQEPVANQAGIDWRSIMNRQVKPTPVQATKPAATASLPTSQPARNWNQLL